MDKSPEAPGDIRLMTTAPLVLLTPSHPNRQNDQKQRERERERVGGWVGGGDKYIFENALIQESSSHIYIYIWRPEMCDKGQIRKR